MSLGIIIESINNNSQDYLMIRCLNEIAKKYDCCVFTNEVKSFPIKPNFAILQLENAFNHKGILISTNILTTQILNNCMMTSNKYFYTQSLEWLNVSELKNASLHRIYCNDNINLIASSESYGKIITKLFKKPSHIIYLWDHEKIGELLK